MASSLLIEQRGDFTVLTLNRPHHRNALSIELIDKLCAAIESANANPIHRAIIFRGAGKSFCAGLDLKQAMQAGSHEDSAVAVARLLKTVYKSKLPTIAVVHGHAMAGGAGLLAACDLAVAARGTRIGFPEVRRGLVPALVCTLLRHQIGDRRMRELFLTGEPIVADRALEFGLINRVVSGGAKGAFAEALQMAGAVAQGAPGALTCTKQLLADIKASTIDADFAHALKFHNHARSGAEAAEGIAAFVEKRNPGWLKP